MSSLPTWAVYLISFGTPLLAFAGGLIGVMFARRGATELEARSRREELMRMLRWASELAISDEEPKRTLGVAQLQSLRDSSLLTVEEIGFVRAALTASIRDPVDQMEQLEQLGEGARVTLVPDPALPALPAVPSETETEREKED